MSKGRVAQTVLDGVTYRNDRVVRPEQGLQRDEPRDATSEAGLVLTLQEEVALPLCCAWGFDEPMRKRASLLAWRLRAIRRLFSHLAAKFGSGALQ